MCGIRLITKMAVGVHVDSDLPSLCRFPLFDLSIEIVEQADEFTRGHFYVNDPIPFGLGRICRCKVLLE
jgi:hypothetical protein